MSDIFGCLTEQLGGADEALALASYAQGTGSYSSSSPHAHHPLLRRSRVYYSPRPAGGLVGLDNQGATCYLNSLLQSLFLTPEFRQLVYDLDDDDIGMSHYLEHEARESAEQDRVARMSDAEKAAHKEALKAASAEPSEEAVEELTSMGMDRVHVIRTLRKFPAPSQKESALDYLFTHDFSLDPPEPVAAAAKPTVRLYKRIPIEFRRFFAHLQLGTQAVIGTDGITRSFGWDSSAGQASVQHDIQELYLRLIEALSGSLKSTPAETRMNHLYQGSMCTRTTCHECGGVSERRESVYNFHAHVKGMHTLTRSIEALVQAERLDGANKYYCSQCKKKTVAWRQDTIGTLPPLLTIALNRHEYSRKTWQRVKVNDRLSFPLRMDMHSAHDEHARKSLHELDADFANFLQTPAEVPPTNQSNNHEEAANEKSHRKNKKGSKKNASESTQHAEADSLPALEASVWSDDSPYVYDLFSVVVHSGGAHGGHYYAYTLDVVGQANYFASHPGAREEYDAFLRAPDVDNAYHGGSARSAHPSFWHECNDTAITPIPFERIATQYGGRRTCAYILMYRQRSLAGSPCSSCDGPRAPAALQAEMARFNEQLAADRVVYEQLVNEIEIEVHTPNEFDVWEGQLVPTGFDPTRLTAEEAEAAARTTANKLDDDEADALEGFAMMGLGGDDDEPDDTQAKEIKKDTTPTADSAPSSNTTAASLSTPTARRLVVDQRITVPELHAKLVSFLSAESGFDARTLDSLDLAAADQLVLNQLSLKLRPPHQVEGYLSLEDPLDVAAASAGEQVASTRRKSRRKNPKTLEQLGFGSVQQLLVWNGRTINGKPFVTGTKKDQVINLRCCICTTPVDGGASADVAPMEFFLAVSPTTNLLQLLTTLSDRTGIPLDALRAYCMHPSSKSIRHLDLGHADDLQKPIKIIGIVNQSTIAIETQAGGQSTAASSAKSYLLSLQQCVKLVVLNPLMADATASSAAASAQPQFEIDVLKSSTVSSFKEAVLSRLVSSHPSLTLDAFRLRKVSGLSKLGPLLVEFDSKGAPLTLQQVDLVEDEMRVTVELGSVPKADELDLLVTVLSNVAVTSEAGGVEKRSLAKVADRVPLLAQRAWTIQQVKRAILDQCGLAHRSESSFALYRGHATYDEHDKPFTVELLTLAQMQVQMSEWVWLEEGEMPTSGKIQLEVALVTTRTRAETTNTGDDTSSVTSDDGGMSPAEWRARQQPTPPYTPPLAPVQDVAPADPAVTLSTPPPPPVTRVFLPPPSAYALTPLFNLDFSSLNSLLELKQVLHAYSDSSPLSAAPTPAHLRVRLCNRNDTPGRMLTGDDKSLKKQQVAADKKILVQILSDAEGPEIGLTSAATMIRLCVGVPALDGGIAVGPSTLHEIVFDGGDHPSLAVLQDALAPRCGIASSDLAVLKWIGVGQKDDDDATDTKNGSTASQPPPAVADAAAAPSSSPPAASPVRGWVVLFPDGPDPTAGPQADATKPKAQQQKANGKAARNNKQQQQTAKGAAPAWHLKSGAFGLHDDDVLMCLSLSDLGCSSLVELAHIVRVWPLGSVSPPGYTLIEKDRAEELERRAERDRTNKARAGRQEIELKIEY